MNALFTYKLYITQPYLQLYPSVPYTPNNNRYRINDTDDYFPSCEPTEYNIDINPTYDPMYSYMPSGSQNASYANTTDISIKFTKNGHIIVYYIAIVINGILVIVIILYGCKKYSKNKYKIQRLQTKPHTSQLYYKQPTNDMYNSSF